MSAANDDSPTSDKRFLVVASNAIVAEDIRDFLSGIPESTVDVRHSMASDWGNQYSVAFFDVCMEELLKDKRVISLRRRGTKLVAMFDDRAKATIRIGIESLPQPFRSADIAAVLERANIKVPDEN